jgi:hypothetical protein
MHGSVWCRKHSQFILIQYIGYKQEASIGHHQPTHASACDQARNKETEYHKKDKQIKEKEQFIQDHTEDNEVSIDLCYVIVGRSKALILLYIS